jgi:hypothetical protein
MQIYHSSNTLTRWRVLFLIPHENPIVSAFGEKPMFYRPHVFYENGQKIMKYKGPRHPALVAIGKKKPQAWDAPQSTYPLTCYRPGNVILIDCDSCVRDGRVSEVVEEAKERLPTYWDISYSGNGRHALAFTELDTLCGRKHLVFQVGDGPREKIELFVRYQSIIITNQHDVLRPVANCDQELLQWVADLEQRYGRVSIPVGKGVVRYRYTVLRGSGFQPWLMRHRYSGNFPGPTKRCILELIWNTPEYAYRDGYKPFYEADVAKQFHMTPQQLSRDLRSLESNGWLFRERRIRKSGMWAVDVKLNITEEDLINQVRIDE